MKYRLKVNVCGKWIIGRIIYNSYIEAQIRQEELRLNGIESKVVDSIGGDAEWLALRKWLIEEKNT